MPSNTDIYNVQSSRVTGKDGSQIIFEESTGLDVRMARRNWKAEKGTTIGELVEIITRLI